MRDAAWKRGRRAWDREPVLLLTLAALAATPLLVNLSAPLLERHAWRQTQTAWTSLLYARDGIDLLHPRIPVFGPPYVLPFEFPIVQAAVALISKLGLGIDPASRLLGVLSLMWLGLATYGVVRMIADRRAATFALVALWFTPFALVWGRSAIVDLPGAALAMTGVLALLRWRARSKPFSWLVGTITLSLAALIKLPVALFLLPLPFLYVAGGSERSTFKRALGALRSPGLWAVVVVVLAVAAGWTTYADSVKLANPATATLASSGLLSWYYGTVAQRLDVHEYVEVFGRMALLGAGTLAPVWLLAAAASVLKGDGRRQAAAWIGMALAVAGPPLLFWGVFIVHAYYAIVVMAPLAAVIGLGAAHLTRPDSTTFQRRVFGLLVLAWIASFLGTTDYWLPSFDPEADQYGFRAPALQIAGATDPSKPIALITGDGWNPAIFYYADRMGWALGTVSDGTVASKCAQGIPVFQVSADLVLPLCEIAPPAASRRSGVQ